MRVPVLPCPAQRREVRPGRTPKPVSPFAAGPGCPRQGRARRPGSAGSGTAPGRWEEKRRQAPLGALGIVGSGGRFVSDRNPVPAGVLRALPCVVSGEKN